MGKKDALALAKDADTIFAAKGKRVVHIDLRKDKPDRDALLGVLLGPTGNLRAPTVRIGRTLLVGFDEGMYKSLLS